MSVKTGQAQVCSLTFKTVIDTIDAWQCALPAPEDALAPSLIITALPEPASPLMVTMFGAAPIIAAVDDLIGRLGVTPVSDDRHDGTHRATKRWLAGNDTLDNRFAYLHSEFFRSPVPAADLIARLIEDRRPGEERELDFSPWGGAYNRVPAAATAFPHRDARFLVKQTAILETAQQPSPWLDESYGLVRPFGTGGSYPNFPERGLLPRKHHSATPAAIGLRPRTGVHGTCHLGQPTSDGHPLVGKRARQPIARGVTEGPTRSRSAADPGVACAVRPSLSACDVSTMRTSPAQSSANAT
jgi:hypothetical protein